MAVVSGGSAAAGVNYFETSRGYGDSEIRLGEALKDIRRQVMFSTKSHPGGKFDGKGSGANTADDVRRYIDESLKRLDTDYLDFYHVWYIDTPGDFEIAVKKGGTLDGIRKARDEGLIREIGLTTHDKNENIIRYLSEADFHLLTLYYNALTGVDLEPVLMAAEKAKVGVVCMGPLSGGILALKSEKTKCLEENEFREPAVSALRYLYRDPRVSSVISSMVSAREVSMNLAALDGLDKLDPDFRQGIDQRIKGADGPGEGLCTACKYCKGCPQEIAIHSMLKAYNKKIIYGFSDQDLQKWCYDNWIEPETLDKCTECLECEGKCPQHLPIMERFAYLKGLKRTLI